MWSAYAWGHPGCRYVNRVRRYSSHMHFNVKSNAESPVFISFQRTTSKNGYNIFKGAQNETAFAWLPLCMSSNRWIGKIPGTGCIHEDGATKHIKKYFFNTFLATLWITLRWNVVKMLWFEAISSEWKNRAANTQCSSDRKFTGNTQSAYTSSNLLTFKDRNRISTF